MEYRELNLHQHCLHRPDTYIGNTTLESRFDYIYESGAMVRKEFDIIPAVERLFVEAVSNAVDNFWRSRDTDTPCTTIKITVDPDTGLTSVWNDGLGIPISKNENDVWIPQLIFGQLLTSSNYDDEEERMTSGRNGIGIKAVNIFSTRFTLECADATRGLVYKQEWSNNMNDRGKPSIRKKEGTKSYTKVSWIPDFKYFGIDGYNPQTLGVIYRHVYETAMITCVKVQLDGSRVPIKQFRDFPKLFTDSKELVVIDNDPDFMVAIVPSSRGFENVSFVNGIHTSDGGVHVDACVESIFKPLLSAIRAKRGISTTLSLRDLKAHFTVFVSCWVKNPKFTSQTKSKLAFPKVKFSVDEKNWKSMLKWSFMERLKDQTESTELVQLQKSERTRGHVAIDGYERANKEGTKNSERCSLILCEGLSAKTYAITGIQNGVDFGGDIGFPRGRDWFGVLALKGKCFAKNTEVMMADGFVKYIQNIKRGDLVRGNDSRVRIVTDTMNGRELLYKIQQSNGVDYTVTGDHVMVLKLMFTSIVSWDAERSGWVGQYFNTRMLRVEEMFVACDSSTKHTAFNNITNFIQSKRVTTRFVRIPLYDYMKLCEKTKALLCGVRVFKNNRSICSNITVTEVGEGEYYGIRISGNHLFLLSDGTVVHNCLNVRTAKKTSIANNNEITNIIQVLGLKYGVDYSKSLHGLRYGRVILMADADDDGLHISGLVLNIFHYLFPSLMKRKDFFFSMMTPVMKITYKNATQRFYTMVDARRFIQSKDLSKLTVKYYKGLGTSSNEDIRETFGKKMIQYTDTHHSNEEMMLVFDKKLAEDRKEWLANPVQPPELDCITDTIYGRRLGDFLRTELVVFSISDCMRNLPSLYDGLKESQRKVLYGCFLRGMNESTSFKVAQLASYVADKTDYHHGEQCLHDTIIRMAQDYVGSNNIPLLLKDGQFGTRVSNGSDAASSRYIFVRLSENTRKLFPPVDDFILPQREEDGIKIEPEHYIPILPMLLVNGCEGIGTGWSSSVPSFCPSQLERWIKAWLVGGDKPKLMPWYQGFKGVISQESEHRFTTTGVLERIKTGKYAVTEIPIGMSQDKFKSICDTLVLDKKIKSFQNYSTHESIRFEISAFEDDPQTLMKMFNLVSKVSTSNLVVLGKNNCIRKYNTVDELMDAYCSHRIETYTKQKEFMSEKLGTERKFLKSKLKFITSVIDDTITVFKRPESEICETLKTRKYPKHEGSYGYLLDIPLRQFTKQKLAQLEKKLENVEKDIRYWRDTSEAEIWTTELDKIKNEWD